MESIKTEYKGKNQEKLIYLTNLKQLVVNSQALLEGNCFYHHRTLNIYPDLYNKQLNLFWCGKEAAENICEIGFNAGHSSMLMLLGRNEKPVNFTIFDIGHHPYTKPCFEYIQSKFQFANFEYVEGDSTVIMPTWIENHKEKMHTYDVVHIDGGHSEHCIQNDMKNTDLLVKKDGIVIVDDTNNATINSYVDTYISSGNYVEVNLFPTNGYPHRIIKKVK